MEKMNEPDPGKHFVAVTDNDTPLVKTAQDYKFRKVFINPSEVGGRYSVLSYFGLLPMALMGIDIKALLSNAQQMKNSCDPFVPTMANPGVSLGCLLGIAQRNGKDKVTFVISPSIQSFGFWVEQLLAESTGKDGQGIIPVQGEMPGDPDAYGNDRIFVHIYLNSEIDNFQSKKIVALEKARHPVVRIGLPDKLALGGEFYRWEVATAIAGMMMGINPFDQPNVAESKKNTDQLLSEWKQNKVFDNPVSEMIIGDNTLYSGRAAAHLLSQPYAKMGSFVQQFTSMAHPGDYIALLPYFLLTEESEKLLNEWRLELRNDYRVATTLLEGPRYLHSTGQLHKGGPDSGLYIIMTRDEKEQMPIPGEEYSFSVLHQAQVLGDFRSLNDKDRRVILLHFDEVVEEALHELMESETSGHTKVY
jgi:hypothetical protein